MAIRVIPIEDKETPDSPVQDIGISLPFIFPNIESTRTTAAAIKSNIRNLLATERGERIMQPDIGLDLDRYLFEQITDDVIIAIQNEIADGFALWFPFLNIEDIMIDSDQQDQFGRNTINIEVQFALTQNPNILGSVQTTIGE